MKRTLTFRRAATPITFIVVGVCLLPLLANADGSQRPEPAQTSHLDTLLTIHDVRNAIHAPRIKWSDCLQSKAEPAR